MIDSKNGCQPMSRSNKIHSFIFLSSPFKLFSNPRFPVENSFVSSRIGSNPSTLICEEALCLDKTTSPMSALL